MLSNDEKYLSTKKTVLGWSELLFVIAVFLIPHNLIIHDLFPIRVLNKSLVLATLLATIVFCSVIALIKLKNKEFFFGNLISMALIFFAIIVRSEYFNLNVFEEIIFSRPLLSIPLILGASFYYIKDDRIYKTLVWTILLTGLIQSLVGICHVYVLPQIVLGAPALERGKLFFVDSVNGAFLRSRESGTIGNPTYYANYIVLSMFTFVWYKPRFNFLPNYLNALLQLVLCFVLILGVLLSLNRLAIIFTVGLAVLSCREIYKMKLKKFLIINSLLLGAVFIFSLNKYPQLIIRFRNEGFIGRTQKYELLFDYLFNSWEYFLLGIPGYIESQLRTIENFSFSDNSMLMLSAEVGIPLFWLWGLNLFATFEYYLEKEFSLLRLLLIASVLVNCFFSELVYCDGWLVFVILLIAMFFNTNKVNLNRSDVYSIK